MMSSKTNILAKIRQTSLPIDPILPDIGSIPHIRYDDPLTQLTELFEKLGGCVKTLNQGDSLKELIASRWPTFEPMVDLRDPQNLNRVTRPQDWQNTQTVIVPAHFAVAENAAVWVSLANNRFRSIYYLSQNIVFLVSKDQIVDNMYQAYQKVKFEEYGFGAFISGSSRTADIELSLVLGAHGPMDAMLVLLA